MYVLMPFAAALLVASSDGDTRHVHFTQDFTRAIEKARKQNRLVFVKPIFGGVNLASMRDYRFGGW